MLKHFYNHNRAQSLLEYTVMIIIIMAVLLSMVSYVKRGIQGRWKSAVDDIGDQYDPRQTNGTTTYWANTQSDTTITTEPARDGYYTNRVDQSHSLEQRTSHIEVGQEGDNFNVAK